MPEPVVIRINRSGRRLVRNVKPGDPCEFCGRALFFVADDAGLSPGWQRFRCPAPCGKTEELRLRRAAV